ncbi:MAG TPA: hypothetical protein DIC37_00765, partial [Pseudomonas sp.]|nr:hypothetical protein [Pseudomonas sp.]
MPPAVRHSHEQPGAHSHAAASSGQSHTARTPDLQQSAGGHHPLCVGQPLPVLAGHANSPL